MTAPHLGFALALHARVAGGAGAGFVWSPYSVASALGLAAAGARGRTRDELVAALTEDGDLERLAAALGAAADLGSEPDPGARIAVANTLWADLALPLSPAYLGAVKSWPGGAARDADFRHDPEGARRDINADVERTTRGLVRDLIGPGLLSRDTGAVIASALWLRASWTGPFDEADTRPQRFRSPGGAVEVPTMRATRRLGYAARGGWQVVSIPAGEGVVAEVLLPDDDLAAAEPDLDAARLEALLAAIRPQEVALELPRFRVEGQASLREPLRALGVGTLFTPEADLSGVTDGAAELAVSDAVHKAVLTVDERGLEGAAATAVMMIRLGYLAPRRPVRVRVDRPFLVLVRHRPSGALYFLARVTDPR